MPVYTRTGDHGETGLHGGKRVTKDDARVEAYGSVDELNAVIGVVLTAYHGPYVSQLRNVQRTLFGVGAQLASATATEIPGIGPDAITRMEKEMDGMEKSLPPLRHFILPGGSESAAALHFARTVCRRAERRVVTLCKKEKIDSQIIPYLNRLSDWLFMLARDANARENVTEEEWKGKN